MCFVPSVQPASAVLQATEPMGYDETTASWTRWEGSFWEDDGWGDNNASFFAMPLPWVQSQDEPELDDDCTDDDDDQAKDGPAMPLLVDINDSKELLYGGLDSSSYDSDVAEEAADTTSIVWHDNAAWSLSDIGQVRSCNHSICSRRPVVSARHDS